MDPSPDSRLPAPSAGSDIPPERRARVEAARLGWIRQLVDMSRRNNLLYFRDLKAGTLDLTAAPAVAMQELLQSARGESGVPLTDLMGAEQRARASASMTEIAGRARSNFEERGLETLFLALGLASWTAADGGRDASAPVLLVPMKAMQASGRAGGWSVTRAGDVKVNDVLVHALREEHGLTLDPEALMPAVLGDDPGEAFDLEPFFGAVTRQAAALPGFRIERRWVLGNFAFQKMAIVKDLQQLTEALAVHDLIAGIAGDAGAAATARGDRIAVDPGGFDRQPPDEEFLIRDADSSQQQAIVATLRGQNGVISGPPGTGKSQTISNLIAEAVARGKTVLFVAEKRAALDVVLNRLKEANLEHLCLDCHGAELTRKHVAEQLQASIERVREAPIPDSEGVHRAFTERRDRLNAHVKALHQPRQPGGLSVYALYGRILRLPADVSSTTRFARPVLNAVDQRVLEECAQAVRELASLSALVLRTSPSPWRDARLASSDQLRGTIEAVRRLVRERWPAWQSASAALLAECPVRPPRRTGEVQPMLEALGALQDTLSRNEPTLFRKPLGEVATALAPARSALGGVLALLFNSAYRHALRELRAVHTAGALSAREALLLAESAAAQAATWRGMVDGDADPRTLTGVARALRTWSDVAADLRVVGAAFPDEHLDSRPLDEIGSWLQALANDSVTPSELLRVHELESALSSRGVVSIVDEFRVRQLPSATWADVLRFAWLQSCLDEIQLQDPSLPAFRGSLHEEIASEFRRLDRERLAVAVQRVQRAHAVAAVEARNAFPAQSALVGREAAKRARHLPLRRLFADAPDVMLALRPCWMASPLSVSQLIPGDRPLFDLVVFDEASQVLPEDAVTSLLRGRQAVIAGDSRQLPPTTFFAAGGIDDGEEDEAGTAGFQSILDVMSAFLEPAWSLDWHYRSRDEALIAYSNHRIYNGRLVTFPGPGMVHAVSHELVPHVPGQGGHEASAGREVQRVVDLVMAHAASRPHETLGVITMGIEHASRIEMALVRARDERPELESFFDAERHERFFVKNLERVQGDERDAIILSIGYGKNEAGDLVYRFGPLLQEGGERRLNVAITRARQRMTVVSSFGHADMRPDYPKLGVRLLRGFLEYASSEGTRLETGTVTDVPLNDFEQSVRDELVRHGMTLVGQVGSSRYRIDLVAMHPSKPGRFVLAIECDGASYHSAPTARDRDRLRQQQLEALGWRFHRIWSTDWFLRRDDEVRRTLDAFRAAVAHADEMDRGAVAPSPPEPPTTPRAGDGPVAAPERVRSSRPRVPEGRLITDYSTSELEAMVRWVLSDGRLPTDEEILAEVVRELGFARRGSRITAAVSAAIRAVKSES